MMPNAKLSGARMKKKKIRSLKALKNQAWRLMSEFSRQKFADSFGQVSCVSCGIRNHWKTMDGGHFYHASRQRPVTYDHRNIHAQCRRCNYYASDARIKYTLFVESKYGTGTAEELRMLKHQGKEMKRLELEETILRLQNDLEKLS